MVTIFITFWIGCIANAIANKQNSITEFQNSISQDQSIILRRQTEILEAQTSLIEEQTQISADALQFEKDKNFSDTAKEYREKINNLFDKITYQDPTLTAVHEKIIKGEEVQVDKNLDRYVNEFEDIGSLYCDGRIRFTDLKIIL